MITYQTLGDMLLRRYVVDYIANAQQLSSPIYSMLKESKKFIPDGDGAYFPVRIDGNESGGRFAGVDNNALPAASHERIKQHRVRPKKYYHIVEFSGIAEAVSNRGGENAFAAAVNDGISMAVKRAGATFEVNFLRGDGTGRLTNTGSTSQTSTVITVSDARPFRVGQVVVFLNNTTGLKVAGPVKVLSRDVANATITLSASVTVAASTGVYISGEQSENAAPAEVTPLGLPAIVNNTGSIYGLSRSTYPVLQSKVISASSTALDESLLRRLRTQILTETEAGSTSGFCYITNYSQFDRYTEIALGFRRFNDNRLELGADQAMTSFEGNQWYISWAALPDQIFFMRMDAVERGVVRPLSIDERVNFQWIPGQDAFAVLLKTYYENVARVVNQTGKLTNLTVPTY